MSNSLYNPFSPMRHLHPRSSGLMTFKGGGGNPTTVETIPDWYRPYIEKAAGSAVSTYDAGNLSRVEGMNENQLGAISSLEGAAKKAGDQYTIGGTSQQVMQDQALGQGAFSPASTEALRTKAIRDAQGAFADTGAQLASSGQVGGARAALLGQERDANLSGALAQIDYDAQAADRASRAQGAGNLLSSTTGMSDLAGKASDYLGSAGSTEQEQAQREADADYQGLSRLASLLSGTPQPGQQAVQGGK
ncbi:hypothetical protein PQZ39_00975 [bacterium]|nr:hypothetical protein [bacterium]